MAKKTGSSLTASPCGCYTIKATNLLGLGRKKWRHLATAPPARVLGEISTRLSF